MSTTTRWAIVKDWHRETSHPDPWKLVLKMGYSHPFDKTEEQLILRGNCLSDPDMRNAPIGARVKITIEIQEPKTKVVPWKAEEVPMPCVIRPKGNASRYSITKITPNGVWSCDTFFTFEALSGYYEHSIDGGKTWRLAGREETTYE